MANKMIRSIALTPIFVLACGGQEDASEVDRFRQALPTAEVLTVEVPEGSSGSLGAGRTEGTVRLDLVGAQADFYVSTYYEARNINRFGREVLALLDAITGPPPTLSAPNAAVWGPFRADREPNEFRLGVEERASPEPHFAWHLEGRPVPAVGADPSAGFVSLAAGAYQPTGPDRGQGWFVVSFEAIRTLNPAEEGRGAVAYAFAKTDEGVAVRMVAEIPDESGASSHAAYAFGQNNAGLGYVIFAFAQDIHEDDPSLAAEEDLVIRTRWMPTGEGRADIVAAGGDVGAGFVQVSQCWDDTFVSRYEALTANGALVAQDGDATQCVFDGDWPEQGVLPRDDELANPFEE